MPETTITIGSYSNLSENSTAEPTTFP